MRKVNEKNNHESQWNDDIRMMRLYMIEFLVVAWAGADRQADQLKGTGIVCDGLSHCCSTPNPLHQTWALTETWGTGSTATVWLTF